MAAFLIAVLAVLGLAFLWLVGSFNRLVTLRNRAKEAWSDIDVQLKRRYDMVPNLVETVRGIRDHEANVFATVTEARSRAMGAQSLKEKGRAEEQLSRALMNFLAVAENYPELKSNQNFLELQRDLRDTEDKLAASRRFYNTNVRDLNTKIETFPTNLMASMFGFKQMELFEAAEADREVPQVKF